MSRTIGALLVFSAALSWAGPLHAGSGDCSWDDPAHHAYFNYQRYLKKYAEDKALPEGRLEFAIQEVWTGLPYEVRAASVAAGEASLNARFSGIAAKGEMTPQEAEFIKAVWGDVGAAVTGKPVAAGLKDIPWNDPEHYAFFNYQRHMAMLSGQGSLPGGAKFYTEGSWKGLTVEERFAKVQGLEAEARESVLRAADKRSMDARSAALVRAFWFGDASIAAPVSPGGDLGWNDPAHRGFFRYQAYLAKALEAGAPEGAQWPLNKDDWEKLSPEERGGKVALGEAQLRKRYERISSADEIGPGDAALVKEVWGAAALTAMRDRASARRKSGKLDEKKDLLAQRGDTLKKALGVPSAGDPPQNEGLKLRLGGLGSMTSDLNSRIGTAEGFTSAVDGSIRRPGDVNGVPLPVADAGGSLSGGSAAKGGSLVHAGAGRGAALRSMGRIGGRKFLSPGANRRYALPVLAGAGMALWAGAFLLWRRGSAVPARASAGLGASLAAAGLSVLDFSWSRKRKVPHKRPHQRHSLDSHLELPPLQPVPGPMHYHDDHAASDVRHGRRPPAHDVPLRGEPIPRVEPAVDAVRKPHVHITKSEQRAIDEWAGSREYAQGQADLFEWLDRHKGRFPDVDLEALKAKLHRR